TPLLHLWAQAPVLFIGPGDGGFQYCMQATLLAKLLAPGDAFCSFLIQKCCLRGAAPGLRQTCDQEGALIPALAHCQQHARGDFATGFKPIAIAVHLAALNGLLGNGASLVDAGGPQPLVQSHTLTGCSFLRHSPAPAVAVMRRNHPVARTPGVSVLRADCPAGGWRADGGCLPAVPV